MERIQTKPQDIPKSTPSQDGMNPKNAKKSLAKAISPVDILAFLIVLMERFDT